MPRPALDCRVAILQALFSFIRGSAGKALNAIFGWAVLALFGQSSKSEQTLLAGVVFAAAAWPLLAIGVAFPKLALFLVAAVPLIGRVPSLWLRLVWVGLALLVPIVVGVVVAARSPPGQLPEPTWKKLLRGFPITLALAGAFFLMLMLAPAQRIKLAIKGRQAARIPVISPEQLNLEIASAMQAALSAHGIKLVFAAPPWTMTAPSKILFKLGGRAFSAMVGEKVEFLTSEHLEVVSAGNELQLRGRQTELARAHALAAEVLAPRAVLQTFDPRAQQMEKQIKRVWAVYADNPAAHRRAPMLRTRRDEIARELFGTPLEYDEFQVVYRELLQLDRALRGEAALLDAAASQGG